jgi:hypothetical protein
VVKIMPFVHPVIFWIGAGAVSAPIIIHLLNRRRFRIREWAAMRFLLDSLRQNRRRLKIEELILLALRCLVVFLLALVAARLTGCQAFEALPLGGAESETAVFVLDDSYSMGQRAGAAELFSTAAADIAVQLAEQLRRLPRSGQFAVIRTSDPTLGRGLAKLTPLTDVRGVAKHLAAGRLADSRADLAGALKAAKILLRGVKGTKRLFILSDYRRADLVPADRAEELRKAFAELEAEKVMIVAADYGLPPRSNLTIQQIDLAESEAGRTGLVLAGVPFRVRVTVRNNSPAAASRVEVQLSGKFRADKAGLFEPVASPVVIPSLAPGQSLPCEFKVVCPQAGPAVLRAELPSDELPGDNAAHLALEVRGALDVLLVDDRKDAAAPEDSESFFLRGALQPGGTGYVCRTHVIAGKDLAGERLEEYDVVGLLNVAEFDVRPAADALSGQSVCPQVEALERYVSAGGGLAIFTGDRTDTAFYGRYLYAGGTGLCPYPLGPRRGDPGQRSEFFRMKVVEDAAARNVRGHLMRFARIGEVDIASLIRFYAFTPARAPEALPPAAAGGKPAEGPVVLARFNDPAASPAIVFKPFGRGRVLLYATTANRRWTDWQAYGTDWFFVTAMNDMVRFLARGQWPGLNGPVGKPLAYDVPPKLRGTDATLARVEPHAPPVGQWQRVGAQVRHDDMARAAAYSLAFRRVGALEREVLFARNADASEGELSLGGEEALEGLIGGSYVYVRRQVDGRPRALWTKPVREYWTWALFAAIALLALETFLAQRFGHYEKS